MNVNFAEGFITGAILTLILTTVERWLKRALTRRGEIIDDGFGNSWSATCPECNQRSMQIVQPGKVQCSNCD